jgi:carnitine O-palmitoyltransferase 1
MADAHQATAYGTSVIHEHTDANHSQEVLQLVWQSFLRSLKKRIARTSNEFRNGVYPAHVESLWIIMGIVMALHFATQSVPYDLVNYLIKFMPE